MTANFATISNVLHTVINSDFFLGNRHNQIIIDPFIYATKDPKVITVLKTRIKRNFFNLIGTLELYRIATLHSPQDDRSPNWMVTVQEDSLELRQLLEQLKVVCPLQVVAPQM
jgi:hypothetical protein